MNEQTLEFIRKGEGLRLKAYQDTRGKWTIGYGTIIYEDGTPVRPGDTVTKERAEILMRTDAARKWNAVKHAIKPPINDNQRAAIVSLIYNIGVGGFLGSTVLKRINAAAAPEAIEAAWLLWDKITKNGKKAVDKGLVNRRKKEVKLFFS